MRVFELARELQVSNQEIIAKLRELGYDVTNHMSSVDDGQARKLKQAFGPNKDAAKDVQEERVKKTVIRRRVVRRKKKPADDARQADDEKATPTAADEASKAKETPPETATEAPAPEPKVAEPQQAEAPADEAPHDEQPDAEAAQAEQEQGGARIVDKIDPPPSTEAKQEREAPRRPRRRIVAKRMYRPSKAEEKKLAKIRKSRQKKKGGAAPESIPTKAEKRKIRIEETITVGDLAKSMGVKASDIIKKFIDMGMMVTINQAVDPDTAGVIASEYNYEIEHVGFQEEEFLPADQTEDRPEDMQSRSPVVTVMGHVDHGKTSILDKLRETRVAAGEAGGITQHIGAYQVDLSGGTITFIDTPGHEAFTAMRARGAEVTDVVILVVAADDGVKPQTVEAVEHAKAADVPIVVAINKCDLPDAEPERIRQQLSEHGLIPEEWGGETFFIEVSATTGEGLDKLLESVLLQAEILELQANPDTSASGVVIESQLDKGRGPVATVVLKSGTLKTGDIVVSGTSYGRVRALVDDTGKQRKSVGPSGAVEILGLNGVPPAGEQFFVVDNEKIARQITENRDRKAREREMHAQSKISLENIYERIQEGEVHELPIVLKADVQGSLEAVRQALEKLTEDETEVRVRIVAASVGGISENDINLAAASGAITIGFNTRPDGKATRMAQQHGVEISVYNIIYDLVEDVRKALQGMLQPEQKETSLGWAKVLETFPIKGIGTVAGCVVESGKVERGKKVRLVRDGQVLYDGEVANLRRYQDDVNEVAAGQECGILLEKFNKVKVDDELEIYDVIELERVLGETA